MKTFTCARLLHPCEKSERIPRVAVSIKGSGVFAGSVLEEDIATYF